jgi:hypothetical protein
MRSEKTNTYGLSSDLWDASLGIGEFWHFYLKREEMEHDTDTYTSPSSSTAQRELVRELEAFIDSSLKAGSVNQQWFGIVNRETMSFDLQINEEILTIAHLRQGKPLLIANLNWTTEEALEVRSHLATFEKDWNAPGMELYDEL